MSNRLRALVKQGRLSAGDLRQPVSTVLADGSTYRTLTVAFNIELGGRAAAGVTPEGADPLLGTGVLKRLGSYMVDNRRSVLVLN